jgi:hypothetical protein
MPWPIDDVQICDFAEFKATPVRQVAGRRKPVELPGNNAPAQLATAENVRAKNSRKIPNFRANLLCVLNRISKQTDFVILARTHAKTPYAKLSKILTLSNQR